MRTFRAFSSLNADFDWDSKIATLYSDLLGWLNIDIHFSHFDISNSDYKPVEWIHGILRNNRIITILNQ